MVIWLPGAAGVCTAVILTLELEGATASEQQSHQNTERLLSRARKRWDISVSGTNSTSSDEFHPYPNYSLSCRLLLAPVVMDGDGPGPCIDS